MIHLKGLDIGYKKTLLRYIHWKSPNNGIVGLFGRNGSGKSTLLKSIAGIVPIVSGDIEINSVSKKQSPPKQWAQKVSYCPTLLSAYGNLSIEDVVFSGRTPYLGWLGKPSAHDLDIVQQSMERLGLQNISHRLVTQCSDGERQKALLASALAQETPVILLDEPNAFLDHPSKLELIDWLQQLSQDRLFIISTHDLNGLGTICSERLLVSGQDLLSNSDVGFEEAWSTYCSGKLP